MSDPSHSEIPDSPAPSAGDVAQSAVVGNAIELAGFQLWLSENRDRVLRVGLITFVIGFVTVGLVLWLTDSLNVENVGYGGVWIVSFVAAGSIVIPVPGPLAVCVASAPDLGLNLVLLGVVSASAEALGEMTGYIAGLSGRSLLERNKYYPRFHSQLQRRGGILLFLGGIIPNPFFDILGIAAGSIGYPIKRFLVIVFFAKAIKSTAIAYLCFWGIDSVTRWLV